MCEERTENPEEVLVGFGGNLGDSVQICRQGIQALAQHPGIVVKKVSSFYRTQPFGFTNQDWFINGAVSLETFLQPESLLALLWDVEKLFGRERKEHWGPRTLDLDLLFYGNRVIRTSHLIVPHPGIAGRRFVLEPLAEIAASKVHPVLLKTVAKMLEELTLFGEEQQLQRLDGICFAF